MLHKNLTGSDLHKAYAHNYATATQRNNPDTPLTAADIGNLALQNDNHSLWILLDNDPITWQQVDASGAVLESDYTTSSILASPADSTTPSPVTIAEQRLVGRITGGSIAALTATQVRTLINVEDGADVTDATNVNAAGALMNSDYGAANRIIATPSDSTTPGVVTVGEQRLVGRITGGSIAALTASQVRTLLDLAYTNSSILSTAPDSTTPAALTIAEQRLVGRITSGSIAALTATQVRTLINVEDGADVTDATNVDAAGAVMTSDYGAANRILATPSDSATPGVVTVGEQNLVGRITGGSIAALTASQVRTLLDLAYTNSSILSTAPDSTTPAALTIAEQRLVGRITGGNIAALTAAQVRTLTGLDFTTSSILSTAPDSTVPAALTVAEQRLVGRITGGNIAALTATQVRTLLDLSSYYVPLIGGSMTGVLTMSADGPQIRWSETDQGTDLKQWGLFPYEQKFYLQTQTDANAAISNVLNIDRGGIMTLGGTPHLLMAIGATPTVGTNQAALVALDQAAGNCCIQAYSEGGNVVKLFTGALVSIPTSTTISTLTGTIGVAGTALQALDDEEPVSWTVTQATYANNNWRRIMDQTNDLKTVVDSVRTQLGYLILRMRDNGLIAAGDS